MNRTWMLCASPVAFVAGMFLASCSSSSSSSEVADGGTDGTAHHGSSSAATNGKSSSGASAASSKGGGIQRFEPRERRQLREQRERRKQLEQRERRIQRFEPQAPQRLGHRRHFGLGSQLGIGDELRIAPHEYRLRQHELRRHDGRVLRNVDGDHGVSAADHALRDHGRHLRRSGLLQDG